MLIDELAAKIATFSGITYTIRAGWHPKDVSTSIVIREVGSTGDELGFGVAGLQYEKPVVAIEVRGAPEDYAGPRAQLEIIFQNLPKVQAETLTGGGQSGYYHIIRPRQGPFLVYIDEQRRPVLSVVFDILKEPSS